MVTPSKNESRSTRRHNNRNSPYKRTTTPSRNINSSPQAVPPSSVLRGLISFVSSPFRRSQAPSVSSDSSEEDDEEDDDREEHVIGRRSLRDDSGEDSDFVEESLNGNVDRSEDEKEEDVFMHQVNGHTYGDSVSKSKGKAIGNGNGFGYSNGKPPLPPPTSSAWMKSTLPPPPKSSTSSSRPPAPATPRSTLPSSQSMPRFYNDAPSFPAPPVPSSSRQTFASNLLNAPPFPANSSLHKSTTSANLWQLSSNSSLASKDILLRYLIEKRDAGEELSSLDQKRLDRLLLESSQQPSSSSNGGIRTLPSALNLFSGLPPPPSPSSSASKPLFSFPAPPTSSSTATGGLKRSTTTSAFPLSQAQGGMSTSFTTSSLSSLANGSASTPNRSSARRRPVYLGPGTSSTTTAQQRAQRRMTLDLIASADEVNDGPSGKKRRKDDGSAVETAKGVKHVSGQVEGRSSQSTPGGLKQSQSMPSFQSEEFTFSAPLPVPPSPQPLNGGSSVMATPEKKTVESRPVNRFLRQGSITAAVSVSSPLRMSTLAASPTPSPSPAKSPSNKHQAPATTPAAQQSPQPQSKAANLLLSLVSPTPAAVPSTSSSSPKQSQPPLLSNPYQSSSLVITAQASPRRNTPRKSAVASRRSMTPLRSSARRMGQKPPPPAEEDEVAGDGSPVKPGKRVRSSGLREEITAGDTPSSTTPKVMEKKAVKLMETFPAPKVLFDEPSSALSAPLPSTLDVNPTKVAFDTFKGLQSNNDGPPSFNPSPSKRKAPLTSSVSAPTSSSPLPATVTPFLTTQTTETSSDVHKSSALKVAPHLLPIVVFKYSLSSPSPPVFISPSDDLARVEAKKVLKHDLEKFDLSKTRSSAPATAAVPGAFNFAAAGFKPAARKSGWDCPVCTLTSPNDKEKCIACDTPRSQPTTSTPAPAPVTGGFNFSAAGFKPMAKKAGWDCPVCTLTTPEDKEKCIACDTPRPKSAAVSAPSSAATSAPASATAGFNWSASGFKPAAKKAGWDCPVCTLTSPDDKDKCIACDAPRPKSMASSSSSSTPAPAPMAAGGFNWGAAGMKPTEKKAGWDCPVCSLRSPEDKDKCVACETPRPKSASMPPPMTRTRTDSSTTVHEGEAPAVAPGVDKPELSKPVLGAYKGSGTEQDPYQVTFSDELHENPQSWSVVRKWVITLTTAVSTLAVGFSSSAYSGGAREIIQQFNTTEEIYTLGISLYVLGFALGPLFWAPLGEMVGRRPVFLISYTGFVAFSAAGAGSPNITALLLFRFLQGTFGSSPLTNSGGIIADCFDAKTRGLALGIFAAMPFLGPVLGPICGGFVGSHAGWKWIYAVMAIFAFVMLIAHVFLVPETYAPVILRNKAAKLSKTTGQRHISMLEAGKPKVSVTQRFKTSMTRPFILLFMEPIVILMSIWMAIVYGILYLDFGAFPIVFEQQRGWSPGISGLAFIGIGVGMGIGIGLNFYFNRVYGRAVDNHDGLAPAEARLPMAMLGGCLLPIGLFSFAWTTYPTLPWIAPILCSAPFGTGMVMIFLAVQNYLIDSYLLHAASVLAANSLLRSLFGFAFPLFTSQMFANLGVQWACTLIAFLALLCMPIPFIFYKYGKHIRGWSKYAPSDEEVRAMMGKGAKPQQEKPLDVEAAPATSAKETTGEPLERVRSHTDRHLDTIIGPPVEGEDQTTNFA